MNDADLRLRLRKLRGRALTFALGVGVFGGVLAALAILALAVWTDVLVDLPAGLRITALITAVVGAAVTVARVFMPASRRFTEPFLASRMDSVAKANGQIHAGVDLLINRPKGASELTADLSQIAIDRATRLASTVSENDIAPPTPLTKAAAITGIVLVFAAIVGSLMPRVVAVEFLRFSDPFGDHPPYSSVSFTVDPGHAKILYGSALDVRATTQGTPSERLEWVFALDASPNTPTSLPMFFDTSGRWQASVANVTAPGAYFVRAGRARSHRFRVDVITVPKIQESHVRVTLPAYTNRSAYEGPVPSHGIAGLPGTKVEVTLTSNRPLTTGGGTVANANKSEPVALANVSERPNAVRGEFLITPMIAAPQGTLSLTVTDTQGQPSTEVFTAPVNLLTDEKPAVKIISPLPNSFATPDIILPVELAAEDDYGIARLQLFRTINDSRSSPATIAVPKPNPTRHDAVHELPLAAIGVQPGDVIKLFARTEDNDPTRPKGAESPVVIVTIISQADFQQMILKRDSMAALEERYARAAELMEKLDAAMAELGKELDAQSKDAELSKELEKKLESLAQQMKEVSDEIAKSAVTPLPFDLDMKLSAQLAKAAMAAKDASEQTQAIPGQPGIKAGGASAKLSELRKKLGGQKQEFKEEATDPLDHLAAIFPLLEDEARFVQLYEQQRDLEQRIASLKDKNNPDPATKLRMEDLEAEQRGYRKELQQLVEDIETHADNLPADPKLDDLRATAKKFAQAARECTAVEEMASAESGLSSGSGKLGHLGAKAAADALQSLMSQCQATGDKAGQCLKFSPQLASQLGNSVKQMLDQEGLSSGPMGAGSRGGRTAARSSLRNVGLYGSKPTQAAQSSKTGKGKADRGSATSGAGEDKGGRTPTSFTASHRQKASGESDTHVPTQYQQQVGDYFQRVADELDQPGKN